MNFRYSALICLFLFGQGHQVRGGEFRGVGKEIVGAATFAIVAVYAGGKVAKDIISGWLYGSKREQESAREAKEKEEREERERQLEWDCQLANQVAAERFAAQRQAEFDANNKAQAEQQEKNIIYKSQVSTILQDQENDLISQFELYQEIEIQELATNYNLSIHQNSDGVSTPPQYMVKRVEALRDYVSGKDVWKEETYQVSTHGQLLLYEHGIKVADYQTYYGNQIQRALHQEFVEIVNDAADLCVIDDTAACDIKNISSTITQFADIGRKYNIAGYVVQAFNFADFCHGLKGCAQWVIQLDCDIAVALGKGVWKGTGNFINKICDPIEAVKNAAKSLGNLILLVAQLDQKMDEKMLELHQSNLNRRREDARNLASGKVTKEEQRARDDAHWAVIKKKLVKDVKVSLDSAWQQINRENMLYVLEKTAEIGTESFLTGQTLKAVSGFIGKSCASLDEFIEAGHGASTLGQLPCNGSSMQAVITYEAVVAQAAAEAARVAQVAGIAVAQVLDDASKLAPGLALMQNGPGGGGPSSVGGPIGNIPNPPTDILKVKQLSSVNEARLAEKFDGACSHNGVPINFRYDHNWNGDINKYGELGGIHQDIMGNLENNGLVKVEKMFPEDFYSGLAYFRGQWLKKSWFPKKWTPDDVMQSVIDVIKNPSTIQQNGVISVIEGIRSSGVKIRVIINNKTGYCHSFYPRLK